MNTKTFNVSVAFDTAPSMSTASIADLKYNKQGVFQMDWDGNVLTAIDGRTLFDTLIFDDGTGAQVNWRGTLAVMGKGNWTDNEIGDAPGTYVTYAQMSDFVNSGWDIANHAMYGTDTGPYNNGGDLEWDLSSLVDLIALRTDYIVNTIINPASATGYSIAGNATGHIANTGTNKEPADTFPCLPEEGWMPLTDISTWPPGFKYLIRDFSDLWDASTLVAFKAKIDALLSDSTTSVHKLFRAGTHDSSPSGWGDFIEYIVSSDTTGKLWICSLRELIEYLALKDNAVIQTNLIGNMLNIQLTIPDITNFRWDDLTLIVSGGTITEVTCDGYDRVTFNSSGLINLFNDRFVTTPANGRVFDVGIGSGHLVIDGDLIGGGVLADDTIRILPGTYDTITIQNIELNLGRVTVFGMPATNVAEGTIYVGNVNGLNLSDINIYGGYRGLVFTGETLKNVTVSAINFSDIQNYCVYWDGRGISYDGTDGTSAMNVKFDDCLFDNTWGITFDGNVNFDANVYTGHAKNIEISNCVFKNHDDYSNQVKLYNAEDINIHNNVFENLYPTNATHCRIIHIQGNGRIYNNIGKNIYGNLAVFWGFSHGTTPMSAMIYNNIVYNSRWYSLSEVQTQLSLIDSANNRSTYVNPIIAFNTAVNMGLDGPGFPAVVVDVYMLQGGIPEIYNNVGVNASPAGNEWVGYNYVTNLAGFVGTPIQSNNLPANNTTGINPYPTITDAGIADTIYFKPLVTSPLFESGIAVAGIASDFYGNERPMSPSVGACEP
ncbi:hypothetical protein [Parapedobacter tibetensis]|uniref:hypothetical protein n=1 Tax=Parapedobacter tibetensis TaxID=2972951 RepID=UPI00214DEB5C|nr:hypothetical protein [Parapedobacter tibetensis]